MDLGMTSITIAGDRWDLKVRILRKYSESTTHSVLKMHEGKSICELVASRSSLVVIKLSHYGPLATQATFLALFSPSHY